MICEVLYKMELVACGPGEVMRPPLRGVAGGLEASTIITEQR